MDQAAKKEFEKLARITQAGFSESRENIDKRFGEADKRFEKVEKRMDDGFKDVDYRLNNVNARLLVIERDIAEIRSHFVYRNEFDDLMARMSYVEKRLKIKSGK